MIDQEATQLAEKITRTWRGSIGTEIWFDMLQELQFGPAEATWRNLRDTLEHQPSIATFRSTYKAQLGTAYEPRIDCPVCGGDGWRTVRYNVHGLPNAGLEPCVCAAGNEIDKVHRGIVGHNNGEFARLGLEPTAVTPYQELTHPAMPSEPTR